MGYARDFLNALSGCCNNYPLVEAHEHSLKCGLGHVRATDGCNTWHIGMADEYDGSYTWTIEKNSKKL